MICNIFLGWDIATVVLSLLAISSAIVTLLLNILELTDGTKRILKWKIKPVRIFFIYITLILSVLTILFQNKKEFDKNAEELTKEKNLRNERQKELEITLARIGQTLTKQEETLDNTDKVLNKQQLELKNQMMHLQDWISCWLAKRKK